MAEFNNSNTTGDNRSSNYDQKYAQFNPSSLNPNQSVDNFSSSSVSSPTSRPRTKQIIQTQPSYHYKLLARVGPRYFSIYDGETEYKLNETLAQPINLENLCGGYYVYNSAEEALAASLPENSALFVAPRVLAKLLCWNQAVAYPKGIIRFSHVKLIETYELHISHLNTKPNKRTLAKIQLGQLYKRLPNFKSPLNNEFIQYMERENLNQMHKQLVDLQGVVSRETAKLLDQRR
jgi:hypothetical protein